MERAFVKLTGCVKRQVQAPQVDALSHFGFTPSEFIPTAWELLPWSFLIDYFVNIGDVIQANIVSLSDLAWANRSDVTAKKHIAVSSPFTAKEYAGLWNCKYAGGDGSTAILESRKWSRSTNVAIGLGELRFQLPGIWAPWANMTALFTQANAEIHPQRHWHR